MNMLRSFNRPCKPSNNFDMWFGKVNNSLFYLCISPHLNIEVTKILLLVQMLVFSLPPFSCSSNPLNFFPEITMLMLTFPTFYKQILLFANSHISFHLFVYSSYNHLSVYLQHPRFSSSLTLLFPSTFQMTCNNLCSSFKGSWEVERELLLHRASCSPLQPSQIPFVHLCKSLTQNEAQPL